MLENDIFELTATNSQYTPPVNSDLDFMLYDDFNLHSAHKLTLQIINSNIAASTPLPPSLPNGLLYIQPPSASYKPPKLVTDNWSGQTYDFYPWLSSVLNGFTLTKCDNTTKVVLMLQAIPLNKRGSLSNINDWPTFKARLIEEFGNINIFGQDVNQVFNLLPCYESVQEVAKNVAPKIKTLQANLQIVNQFHDVNDLHSFALTLHLIQNIMRSLPIEVRWSFNNRFMEFQEKDPPNVRPTATFLFLAQYVNKLEKNYRANPSLFDLCFLPLNVGIKPVWYRSPSNQPQRPHRPLNQPNTQFPRQPPYRPCPLCTSKGFQSAHYTLNYECRVAKLSSPDILKIISDIGASPSCANVHDPSYKCKLIFFNGASKVCTMH